MAGTRSPSRDADIARMYAAECASRGFAPNEAACAALQATQRQAQARGAQLASLSLAAAAHTLMPPRLRAYCSEHDAKSASSTCARTHWQTVGQPPLQLCCPDTAAAPRPPGQQVRHPRRERSHARGEAGAEALLPRLPPLARRIGEEGVRELHNAALSQPVCSCSVRLEGNPAPVPLLLAGRRAQAAKQAALAVDVERAVHAVCDSPPALWDGPRPKPKTTTSRHKAISTRSPPARSRSTPATRSAPVTPVGRPASAAHRPSPLGTRSIASTTPSAGRVASLTDRGLTRPPLRFQLPPRSCVCVCVGTRSTPSLGYRRSSRASTCPTIACGGWLGLRNSPSCASSTSQKTPSAASAPWAARLASMRCALLTTE